MELRVLGPLEVVGSAGSVKLGGTKIRVLLALLAVHVGESVSEDRLIDALWDDAAPRTADKTLRSYVSRLRKALAPSEGRLVVESTPDGYSLRAAEDTLDVARVEGLAAQAAEAGERGDHAWAAVALSEALRTWRGAPLGEFGDEPWATAEAARLAELRQTLVEARIDAELACGRHAALVPELDALTAEHPLRENLWGQRMVALYRSGRQADALRVYQELRSVLADELGIDPSHELKQLEQQVLAQDRALDWTPDAKAASSLPRTPQAQPRPLEGQPQTLEAQPRPFEAQPLPSGVVTYLLTDIEDSAALWDAAPSAMADALARHDALARTAVHTHGGVLLKARGEGDSTFSVFSRATDAVAAARVLHRVMLTEAWPREAPIRVRIALHTGEALERDGDYYGPAVNRVARLREIAEGGQIVVSNATAALVVDHLPAGCTLVEGGTQELRGLSRPEALYLLSVPAVAPAAGPVTGGAAVPLPMRLATPPFTGFHGRAAELDLLRLRLKEVADGARRVVFIAGEPGIGKTSLAAEAAREAAATGATVLYGRCDDELGVPYLPWTEALGHLAEHASERLVERLDGRQLADLTRVVPHLATRVVDPAPAVGDREAERYLVFGAVVAALATVAADGPVVLVLDDLQWADAPTLHLLRHVVAMSEHLSLLVVATYRDSELSAQHPLTDTLAALRRAAGVDRLTLDGLDDDELIATVEAIAGQPLEGAELELVHAVYRETDGNPFFAWEIMRHLADTGAVTLSETGRWSVQGEFDPGVLPESVREVIGHRVARLGDDVRNAVAMAAVIGRDFGLDVLAAALDAPADAVLEHLERAETAGLIATVTPGQFTFVHALIGHTLDADLTPTRQALAHRRVAEAIEELGLVEQHLAELARHWQAAATPADTAKAVEYAHRAGDRALATLAPDEAVRWYRQALAGLDAGPERDQQRCELLLQLGQAQKQTGDPAHRETLLDAAEIARRRGDAARLTRAAMANTRGTGMTGAVDAERVETIEAALSMTEDADSAERAGLLATLAAELMFSADGRRRQLADEALAMARRVDDAAMFVWVATRWMHVHQPDAVDERVALGAETAALAAALGDPVLEFEALNPGVTAALEIGDIDDADATTRRMGELAERVGQPTLRWLATYYRSMVVLLRGDVEEAEQLSQVALELGQAAGQPDAFTIYGAQLFALRWQQGRGQDLDALLGGAEADSGITAFAAARALVGLEAGRDDVELPRLEDLAALPDDAARVVGLATWAEVAGRTAAGEMSAWLYDVLFPYRAQHANTGVVCLGAVPHYLGLLATVLGRFDDADRHFSEAAAMHERLQAPFFLARTWLEWGRMLLRRGAASDREAALELLERARSTAAEYGYAEVEERAQDALTVASRVPAPAALVAMGERPFVGRAAELARLRAAWERAQTGQRELILLAGEAGIGKTRLAAEFALEADGAGATVLLGRCVEETLTPYQPFVEGLQHYVDHVGGEQLRHHTERTGPELVRLAPRLADRVSDLPAALPEGTEGERFRLFAAVNDFLAAVSGATPVVLVIEDLHWADPGTLLLLRHLFRQAEPAALLIVGTYRDVEVSSAHALSEALSELHRARPDARVQLGGLSADEVPGLLDESSRELAEEVWRRTEGNPFFVEELTRHLAETADRHGIPEGVRDIISRRLGLLGEDTRTVLVTASVLGRGFDLQVLEALVDLDPDAIVATLDEAAGSGLIAELPGAFGRYEFGHALVRETLYSGLSTVRKARLHLHVGEALERLGSSDAELARHFYESAPAGGAERAVRYALGAAEAAMNQLAYEEAAGYYERALEINDTAAPIERVDILLALGEARRRAGKLVMARQVFRETAAVAREVSPAHFARAVLGAGAKVGRLVATIDRDLVAWLEEAIAVIGTGDSTLRVRLLVRLAEELFFADEAERRIELRDEAVAMAERLGDPEALLEVRFISDHHRMDRDALASILDLAEGLGDGEAVFVARFLRHDAFLEAGEREAALEELAVAEELASQLKIPILRPWVLALRAVWCWIDGDFAGADALSAEALELVNEVDDSGDASMVFGGQAIAHVLFRQDFTDFVFVLEELAQSNPHEVSYRLALAFMYAETGQLADAAACLEQLAADHFAEVTQGDPAFFPNSLFMLPEVLVALNDRARAAEWYDQCAHRAGTWGVTGVYSWGPADTRLGILATLIERFDIAEGHFTSAMQLATRMCSPVWLADAQYQYGLMLLIREADGDHVQAAALLESALATAREIGMATAAPKMEAALERARSG